MSKDDYPHMIELTDLTKVYGQGDDRIVVLDRINFRVDAGEILAVVGPSGAGKAHWRNASTS
jgi:D-methionine transport system ATP-binding protein